MMKSITSNNIKLPMVNRFCRVKPAIRKYIDVLRKDKKVL